jgi:hypothetical protein
MKVRPGAGMLKDWTKKPKQKEGELKARVRSGCGVQGEGKKKVG